MARGRKKCPTTSGLEIPTYGGGFRNDVANAWTKRFEDYTAWDRRLGDWRRQVGIRLGLARRPGIHCSNPRGTEPRHELDRHGCRLRAGPFVNRRPPRPKDFHTPPKYSPQ